MSGLYTQLVAGLLFPLHERLKRHATVSIRRTLERSQWHDRATLDAAQAERLAAFIARAVERVPYYGELFAAHGLRAGDVRSPADLARLPLLDKPTIAANFDALTARDAGPTSRFTTGGSSGQPLTFRLSTERVSHDVAEKWRATRWWDVDIGDREIVAWGSPIELGAQDRVRVARDWLFRSELIPAFDMNETKLLGFIERIRAFRPRMLFGYPSVFDLIARTARTRGIALDNLGIKVAFVTSERLYPYQRESIEAAFGCPVANGYGSRDAGFIAHQCPAGGMHLSHEDIVVEIVDRDGQPLPPGESGEIVVTHLATGDFPFVRYRTGDIATFSEEACACGRGLPMLEAIEGRSTDFVLAADGTLMHGLALIYVMRELDGIEAFRIVQERIDLTRVEVAPAGDALDPGTRAQIVRGLQARLGEAVQIAVETVDRIEPEKSGKYRYVLSRIT